MGPSNYLVVVLLLPVFELGIGFNLEIVSDSVVEVAPPVRFYQDGLPSCLHGAILRACKTHKHITFKMRDVWFF